ncbi:F-box/kelch-repeat protein At3g23880-like [Silene latifolia]|uniref:F-box/kelch-repeat protein At3g23880-like n=1 Tax=Silene latifolia TaxID=37657 RepID=UPI003D7767BC
MLKKMKNGRKKAKSSSSESNYLPPEVWTLILLPLPAKTLLKFRCVCKYWCSIIDDRDFIDMHLQLCHINSGNNKLLLILEWLGCDGDEKWWLTLLDSKTLQNTSRIFWESAFYSYYIIGSCNGLLLLVQHDEYGNKEELRLWNPCIRKSLILPTCPLPWYLFGTRFLLGYTSDCKDYKVVAFAFENAQVIVPEKIQFAVYTLRDQLWTVNTTTTSISMLELSSLSTAVFFRGEAYWLANNDKQRSGLLTHLGSFNFDKERIAFLELPISLDKTSSLRFLFILGESLAVFTISKVSSSIWVLEQDNIKRPWTLWFSGESSWNGYALFKLCYSKHEKVLYCESDGGYFVYTNKTYNIASCQVREFNKNMSSYSQLERYSESLVLSKGYGSCNLRVFP